MLLGAGINTHVLKLWLMIKKMPGRHFDAPGKSNREEIAKLRHPEIGSAQATRR